MSGEGEATAKPLYPDEDQEVLDAIATRAKAGGRYPGQDVLEVMEQTVDRLVSGSTLLVDTAGCTRGRGTSRRSSSPTG